MYEIELKEQVGVAINPRSQTADSVGDVALKIGALARVDELGALLLRMKYGDDKRRSGLHRAVLLLAKRERSSVRFRRGKYIAFKREIREAPHATPQSPMADVIERFSAAVLEAWLDDMCGACSGRGNVGGKEDVESGTAACGTCGATGKVAVGSHVTPFCSWPYGVARDEPVKRGQRYEAPTTGLPVCEMMTRTEFDGCPACAGIGRIVTRARSVSRQVCRVCSGTGKRWQIPAQRAHAMQVSLGQYQAHWHERFESSLRMLAALDEWTDLQLRRELRAKPLANPK
ncbi:hypothetical protein [Paraburkholderia terricola]|uniref:CR-type domain-containing protein n=1 Tax=Paraburkholderia terricola TaxID=169427 RepID=A0A1M6XG03_9BURK|nr:MULTISPECIES: hypothetical protein [Paraburkholderia]SDP40200.1 hypothetical protein SAMN05192547_107322 [Paraburkholderia sediminicola]SHL04896.1 hypothetical protein SAMN05192548_105549 [Paraburkholderia terricola]